MGKAEAVRVTAKMYADAVERAERWERTARWLARRLGLVQQPSPLEASRWTLNEQGERNAAEWLSLAAKEAEQHG